jgi:hypothetical protein
MDVDHSNRAYLEAIVESDPSGGSFMTMRKLILICVLAILSNATSAESFVITSGKLAPWAEPGTPIDPRYQGATVQFTDKGVVAPHPLQCDGARYEWIFLPLDGLFEGGLHKPEEARANGLATANVPTLRAACATGSFDYHRTASGELRLALDNVVWSLRSTAERADPETVVRDFLLEHFTHDMALTRESIALKRRFLSIPLAQALDTWFALPQEEGEVPDINGDPFTDSQEYPDRFSLGPVRGSATQAMVPVDFSNGQATKRVTYRLARESGAWRVNDVVDPRGGSLRQRLFAATPLGEFMSALREALASKDDSRVAALIHTPFLYEGKELDRKGVAAIVPALFTPTVRKCLATIEPTSEDDRYVAFCKPYAFYIGKDGGVLRILEFSADGEDVM